MIDKAPIEAVLTFFQKRIGLLALLFSAAVLGAMLSLMSVAQSDAAAHLPPESVASVFSETFDESDRIPDADGLEIELGERSSRLIHANHMDSYWIAADTAGDICFVVRRTVEDEDWVMAATCQAPEFFRSNGLALSVRLLGTGVDATLLPDHFATPVVALDVIRSGGRMLEEGLLVYPIGERPSELRVSLPTGETLELGAVGPVRDLAR